MEIDKSLERPVFDNGVISRARKLSHIIVIVEDSHRDILADQPFDPSRNQHTYLSHEEILCPIATPGNRITSLETTRRRHLAYFHLRRSV